jgi:hypothetical protein
LPFTASQHTCDNPPQVTHTLLCATVKASVQPMLPPQGAWPSRPQAPLEQPCDVQVVPSLHELPGATQRPSA